MSEAVARRIVVHGRVQGVGYRESLRREAAREGVAGWVRNRRDGTVEAILQGEAVAVERLVAWAGDGPSGARVTSIEVEPVEPGSFPGFEHHPTA